MRANPAFQAIEKHPFLHGLPKPRKESSLGISPVSAGPIRSGDTSVNVHTTQNFPSGEIRGQIRIQ
jgi:hypothetical protein